MAACADVALAKETTLDTPIASTNAIRRSAAHFFSEEVMPGILELVRAVRAEAFNARTLFLFGSYTIGKERVFLSVARALNE